MEELNELSAEFSSMMFRTEQKENGGQKRRNRKDQDLFTAHLATFDMFVLGVL